MEQIINFFEQIHFTPQYGDWSSALITLFVSLFMFAGFMIRSIKSLNEDKERRKEQERARIVEEDENFMKYRERFANLWLELTVFGNAILYKNFKDKSELMEVLDEKTTQNVGRIKTITYQVMVLLSDIEFIYCEKQKTAYWKRWHSTFKYVFGKKLFVTAFMQHRKDLEEMNFSFVEYVDEVIKENNPSNEPLVLEDDVLNLKKVNV